jgi:hypothetical protein
MSSSRRGRTKLQNHDVFKDLKQSMFHVVLLAWARKVAVGTHTCEYVCQWAHRVLAQGASHGECSLGNLFYAK